MSFSIHCFQTTFIHSMTVKTLIMPHLNIEGSQTIKSLQEQFNGIFPFLKLEFFTEPHKAGQLSWKNKMIASSMKLGDLQKIKNTGMIDVNGSSTVGNLENTFEEKYGLYVQVFRKSGNIWLETSATDNWTLDQQNEEGRSLQQHFKTEKEDLTDRDLY